MAANDKFPIFYRDKLMILIQLQLSHKQKTFSKSFSAFSKCRLNFEHFLKGGDPRRFCISEFKDSENVAR